jgi:hypothetical protein
LCVDILDTRELKKTLDSGRGNETCTTGGRDKLDVLVDTPQKVYS